MFNNKKILPSFLHVNLKVFFSLGVRLLKISEYLVKRQPFIFVIQHYIKGGDS